MQWDLPSTLSRSGHSVFLPPRASLPCICAAAAKPDAPVMELFTQGYLPPDQYPPPVMELFIQGHLPPPQQIAPFVVQPQPQPPVVQRVVQQVERPQQIVQPVQRQIVERVVHVPVEKVVEKVVHVPVERVVERVVHVPVERVVEVERPVPVSAVHVFRNSASIHVPSRARERMPVRAYACGLCAWAKSTVIAN